MRLLHRWESMYQMLDWHDSSCQTGLHDPYIGMQVQCVLGSRLPRAPAMVRGGGIHGNGPCAFGGMFVGIGMIVPIAGRLGTHR